MYKQRNPPQAQDAAPPTRVDARWDSVAGTYYDDESFECADFLLAHHIFENRPFRRAELEARICANQPPAVIAARMHLGIAAVTAYENWFFDVRRYLQNIGWVVRVVLEDSSYCDSYELLWKWVGFNLGISALEELLAAISPEKLDENGIEAYHSPRAKLDPGFKQILASLCDWPEGRTAIRTSSQQNLKLKLAEQFLARCRAEREQREQQAGLEAQMPQPDTAGPEELPVCPATVARPASACENSSLEVFGVA